MATPEAGWYADPGTPQQLRYWDGQQWTEHTQAQASAPPATVAAPAAGATEFTPGPALESDGPNFLQAPVPAAPDAPAAPAAPSFEPFAPSAPVAPRRGGRRAGVVIGITVASVVTLAALAGGAWWAMDQWVGSEDDGEEAAAVEVPAEPTYTTPAGFVEVEEALTGTRVAYPEEFEDYTALYRQIVNPDALDSATEDVTLVVAVMSGTSLSGTMDEFVVVHTDMAFEVPAQMFHAASLRSLEATGGAMQWGEPVTRTTPLGLEVTTSVGTPENAGVRQITLVTATRGDQAITASCLDYGEGSQCARFPEVIDTVWLAP